MKMYAAMLMMFVFLLPACGTTGSKRASTADADAGTTGTPIMTEASVESVQSMVAAINRSLQATNAPRPVVVRWAGLASETDAESLQRMDAGLLSLMNQLGETLSIKFIPDSPRAARTPYELTGNLIPFNADDPFASTLVNLTLFGPTADNPRTTMWQDVANIQID